MRQWGRRRGRGFPRAVPRGEAPQGRAGQGQAPQLHYTCQTGHQQDADQDQQLGKSQTTVWWRKKCTFSHVNVSSHYWLRNGQNVTDLCGMCSLLILWSFSIKKVPSALPLEEVNDDVTLIWIKTFLDTGEIWDVSWWIIHMVRLSTFFLLSSYLTLYKSIN